MKIVYKLVSLLIIIFFPVDINCRYIWQNMTAQERDVFMIDSLNVYIVGEDGRVLRSYDGGTKWIWQETYIRTNYNSVNFIDKDYGAIAGDSGFVLITTNGGNNWIHFKISQNDLNSIKIIDKETIITAGANGNVYKTIDAGKTWQLKYSNDSTRLNRIKFIDKNIGYICGENGIVLKTEDGGENWISLFPYNINYRLASVEFFDVETGVIGGLDSNEKKSIIYYTTDAGKNWILKKTEKWGFWVGIVMKSKNDILMFSHPGQILKTNNLFKSYTYDTITTKEYYDYFPPSISFKSVSTDNNGNILALGWNHGLVKSNDTGKTFKVINWSQFINIFNQLGIYLADIVILNTEELLSYGEEGRIFKSIDGGVMWNNVYPRDANEYTKIVHSTLFTHKFYDEKSGFLAGKRLPQTQDTPIHEFFTIYTSDGGITWKAIDKLRARAMTFIDDKTGFAVSDSTFWNTTDGGETWARKTIFLEKSQMIFDGLYFNNDKINTIGYIWGRQGKYFTDDTINYPRYTAYRLLKTYDGGNSWDTIQTIGNKNFYVNGIYFLNEDTGFIFGVHHSILKTTNGGKDWHEIQLDGKIRNIYTMRFFDEKNGIIGGVMDTIFITTDGGMNWKVEYIPIRSFYFPSSYNNVVYKNKDTVFLLGLERIVRGINAEDSLTNISIEGSFNPNFFITTYLNPYNNSIRININGLNSIKGYPLTMKVYNIFGVEIADLSYLANQYNNGMVSEFSIDLKSLPSGVYFFRLSSNNYAKTFKFIKLE